MQESGALYNVQWVRSNGQILKYRVIGVFAGNGDVYFSLEVHLLLI